MWTSAIFMKSPEESLNLIGLKCHMSKEEKLIVSPEIDLGFTTWSLVYTRPFKQFP